MEEKIFCTVCGAELQPEQVFCPKCGTSRAVANKEFCAACGQKAGLMASPQAPAKKKFPVAIVIAAAVLVLAAVAAYFLLPKLLVSAEDLCAEGRYVEACEKADEEMLDAIRAECAAAMISTDIANSLKNRDSFVLRDVYYKDINGAPELILFANGTNGFGGVAGSYWHYKWDAETEGWEKHGSVDDLEDEIADDSDDNLEKLEIFLENMYRSSMREVIADGTQLEQDPIERINDLFEQRLLDNIDPLDFTAEIEPLP